MEEMMRGGESWDEMMRGRRGEGVEGEGTQAKHEQKVYSLVLKSISSWIMNFALRSVNSVACCTIEVVTLSNCRVDKIR